MKKLLYIVLLATTIFPVLAFAKIGVGTGTGKIKVEELLKPGLIYTLPSFTVINTGDEPSQYGVGIQYRENQPEMKPSKEWFSFAPASFYLEPGKSQAVQVILTLPVSGVKPGDYFAFLQGFPIKTITKGETSIGVAAAAKLYFTVAPANIFQGIYYRIMNIVQIYSPWSYIILAVIAMAIIIVILRRFVSFNFGISFKKK